MPTISSAYETSDRTLSIADSTLSGGTTRRGDAIPAVRISANFDGTHFVAYIDELVDALDELSIEGLTVEYEKPFALPATPGAIIEADLRGKPIRFIRSGGRNSARWINTLDSLTRTDAELKAWFQTPGQPTTFTIISN